MTKTFEARYVGRCGSCADEIVPGELVRFVDDTLVHSTCTDPDGERSPVRQVASAVVCTECWLEKPCPCDDGQGGMG